jgi:hypothetical protein
MKRTHKKLLPLAGLAGFVIAATSANAATTAYRDVILGDNPIVYYEFDETSGSTAANSATTGATYTGTFNTTGGPVTVGQSSFAQGGTAYDFGGGFIGAASALTTSLPEWTVEAWVNYDSAKTSASNFLSNDQGGWNNDVLIGIGAESGNVGVPAGSVGAIQQGSPGTTRDAAGSILGANEWHHVVLTGSTTAGELTVYIDGVLAGSDTALVNGATFNGADGIGTANLTIGAARPDSADAGYRPYDGLLDEVAIYDSVLDASTIDAHYKAGLVPEPDTGLSLAITPAESGYDLAWASRSGMSYNVRSSPDLNGEISTWTLVQGDIAATPDFNTFPVTPTESKLFYALEEYLPVDPTIEFFDDIDGWIWIRNNGAAFGSQALTAVADPDGDRDGTVVKFDYDNSGPDGSDFAFALDSGPIDLSQYDEMVLWKKCAVDNTLETKLYLHINDTNNDESARVEIRDSDPRLSTQSEEPGVWLKWTIDLHADLDFSKSEGRASSLDDLTDFSSFFLGCWSSNGGIGTIYFDDLQLIKRP